MILLISTCKEFLHELEFVNPVQKILSNNNIDFFTKHYSKIREEDLKKADKVIICGTSLKDGEYLFPKNFKSFVWIKNFQKPILGICAGAQILAIIHGQKVFACKEIGNVPIVLKKELFGSIGKMQVYALHQMAFSVPKDKFIEFAKSKKCIHAFKVLDKPFYGVLFHPEVHNQSIIENFSK